METKIDAHGLFIEGEAGGWLCDYRTIHDEAKRQERNGYRFWQAFYNIAMEQGQHMWRHPWPKLFYAVAHHAGEAELLKYFSIIDGYIVPK